MTQYSCDYVNLAPEGCTQYFFGPAATDTVQTYNFDSGQHLASQNHNICVRWGGREGTLSWEEKGEREGKKESIKLKITLISSGLCFACRRERGNCR